MIRVFLSALLIIFVSTSLRAQSANATELMNKGSYAKATVLFEKAVSVNNPEYTDLTNLAYCYIMLHDFKKAEPVYEKVLAHPKKDNMQHFYYGEVLRINGKYEKAKEQYILFKASFPEDFRGDQRIISCDSIQVWNNNISKISIGKISAINTPNDEMFPWPVDGALFFSSNNRILLSSSGGATSFTDPLISNIFSYQLGKTTVKKFSVADSCSFTAYMPAYGQEVLLSKKIKITANGEELSPSKINIGQTDFAPTNAPEGFVFSHPCLAKGGKRIYFVSDMPGGEGGTDLYYSDFDGTIWGPAISAGSTINTSGDEMFPYVTANDSLLFFSSDGHPGYGNMDIFVSHVNNGSWQNPVNMKSPVNTIGNDFSWVYSNYPWEGYLVSNRYPESKGENDIFSFTVEKPTSIVTPDTTRPFVYNADPDLHYAFFKTGSIELEPAYTGILDSLASLMKKYDYLNLNITSFADIRGTESMNNKLVTDRLNAVIAYFAASGVNSNRMVSVPGKVSSDRDLPNLTFHVQLGFIKKENQEAYFEWRSYNKYKIYSLKKGNGYSYFTGNGSLSDMNKLTNEINAKFTFGAFVIVSYRNIILDDTVYSPNRRVEMKLFNQ